MGSYYIYLYLYYHITYIYISVYMHSTMKTYLIINANIRYLKIKKKYIHTDFNHIYILFYAGWFYMLYDG